MVQRDVYKDLKGREILLVGLDAQEQKLLRLLKNRARTNPDWCDFRNFWTKAVADFYDARGMTREESRHTVVYQIAQDLSGRLGIASGMVRLGDYRDDLEEIIRTQFKTQREFCKATGLSEDMLSHVLRRRKHLAIDTLAEALQRIGYGLHIRPLPKIEPTSPAKPSKTRRRSAG